MSDRLDPLDPLEEARQRIEALERRSKRSRNERQAILLLMVSMLFLVLAVKIQVDETGKRSFSFDGAAINLEFITEIASLIFVGTAGYKAFQDRQDNPDD